MKEFGIQEPAFDASAVFRVVSGILNTPLACQIPRRDRWVFLLLDGKRTVADVARLTHRGELDIAYTLAQFLQWGYIEPVNMVEFRTNGYGSA